MLDPAQLSALAAVLRLGSFDRAAASLNVTPSAISQRIKALEEQVGTALIIRGAPCTATTAGQRLARHAETLHMLNAGVLQDLGLHLDANTPHIRIAVNADSLATWFIPALAETPGFRYDLLIDDQDHSADWLRTGEVSAAISSSGKPVAGCDQVPLGTLRYIATASPAFKDTWFGDGITADTLSRAPCLTFDAKDALQSTWSAARAGRPVSPPCHYLPSTHVFIDAAALGLGWGMNPEPLIRAHLDAGTLVALAPEHPLDTPLDWLVSRHVAPALSRLTQSVKAAARDVLRPQP